jgi:hypothetical protein
MLGKILYFGVVLIYAIYNLYKLSTIGLASYHACY